MSGEPTVSWRESIRAWLTGHPLAALLLLGALLRLLAACFSPGFLAADDHHVLVEHADHLAAGIPLPRSYQRSFLYPWVVSLVMTAARAAGVTAPAMEMLIVRLLQGAVSLLAIVLVYRILERRADRESAVLGALLVAVLFVFPVTSVHQFEEVACQVPLLAGCWWIVRAEDSRERAAAWGLLAGLAAGTALIVRFQLLSFLLPLLALAWLRRPRDVAPAFTVGLLLVLGVQCASNWQINGDPWFSLRRYYGPVMASPDVLATDAGGYPSGPPWQYLLTLLWMFIPPFSLVAMAAMVRGGRRLPLFGIPALLFLVAHSLIANKQERFLLPVLPVLALLAGAGFADVRGWFGQRGWPRAYTALWTWAGGVNALLLVVSVFTYGKKDRVAPLVAIERRHDATGVVLAQYAYTFKVPAYYLGRPRPPVLVLSNRDSLSVDTERLRGAAVRPNYLVLYSNDIPADSAGLSAALAAPLARVATISPSLGDWLAHQANPGHNKTRIAVVYAIGPAPSTGP
jgi:hypothetical protein